MPKSLLILFTQLMKMTRSSHIHQISPHSYSLSSKMAATKITYLKKGRKAKLKARRKKILAPRPRKMMILDLRKQNGIREEMKLMSSRKFSSSSSWGGKRKVRTIFLISQSFTNVIQTTMRLYRLKSF